MASLKPEFFDIFGLGTFGFITIVSLRALSTGQTLPNWVLVIFLVIGICGLAVDGSIVWRTYVKKSK